MGQGGRGKKRAGRGGGGGGGESGGWGRGEQGGGGRRRGEWGVGKGRAGRGGGGGKGGDLMAVEHTSVAVVINVQVGSHGVTEGSCSRYSTELLNKEVTSL